MNSIYILWQEHSTRMWYPVAKLTRTDELYRLNYTKGANNANDFVPFPNMSDLSKVYESKNLFPFFNNRILPKSRPEFSKITNWLNIDKENFDPLDYLAITGGQRKTDNYKILKLPELIDGKYKFTFLVSGIQYLDDDSKSVINDLSQESELFYLYETENIYDPNAIALYESKSKIFIGYCPRYLVSDFKRLLDLNETGEVFFKVSKVNLDAPASYRLLVTFEARFSPGYQPLMVDDYLAHTIVHM
ncbi:MAG: hypothetical protein ACI83B_004186 [Sediminicola sp.]|jgi:hypothetical protein